MEHSRLRKNVTSNFPEQISLALSTPTSMWVSWVTGDAQIGLNVTPIHDPLTVGSEVWYGKESGNYTEKRSGISLVYSLEPQTKYFYKCGDSSLAEMSEEFVFETLPLPGSGKYPARIAVVGDLGLTSNSSTTIDHLIYLTTGGKGVSCYSFEFPNSATRETYQPRWDGWGRFMQPLTSRIPMMVIEGNHEIEPQVANTTFLSYVTRFSVPSNESGSGSNLYYSFDAGGVHFIMLGAYVDYNQNGNQYAWLQRDLEKVDRDKTPWLVASWHPPWYNSYSSHYQEFECMRLQMESILYQYRVDIVFSGHVHAYERMNRVYNYTLDSCGPVYITVGDGGNIEKVDVDHADEPGKCPSSGDNIPEFGGVCHMKFSFGPAKGKFCWDTQPEWSAYRESSFGHGILEVMNSTDALWTWHRNQDIYEDDSHGDLIYIVRQPELCSVGSMKSSHTGSMNFR
ncbi:hypothetical protein ACJIZ3_013647 [Penstemon smallii]|uniref:Purple acid phosphatase n=1 Tax=Penstemon smallii TaxID=265156 RepID=A0ABD3RH67_9LAMI